MPKSIYNMKNLKLILPLGVLVAMATVSCSKEQTNLNRMEGRWKLTERKLVNMPSVPAATGENMYLDFNKCKTGEACLCQGEKYGDAGELIASETIVFKMDGDDKKFQFGDNMADIMTLTGKKFVFQLGDSLYREQSTFTKE